jgi:alkylhydroperoxidase family enzyme
MPKDYIILDGRKCRVEVNWNALAAFLRDSGQNDLAALASVHALKPSDIAGLLAAAVNEGERLDGREAHFTAEQIGSMPGSIAAISEFIRIFARQMSPDREPEQKKD